MEIILTIAILYVVALLGTTFMLLIVSRLPEKPEKVIGVEGSAQRQQSVVATEASR
jgi:cell division septal protein FtsQ